MEQIDIDSLNDSELHEMLKENNIEAGPIVDSTRNIYKKKLKKVLYGVAQKEEEVAYGSEDEDEEEEEAEQLDDVDHGKYDSKADTDDDQPSGVSRSVETPSGLKKRFHNKDNDSTAAFGEKMEKHDPNDHMESKSSECINKAVLAMMVFGLLAFIIICIFFSNDRSTEILDSMQEAIQDAAKKVAEKIHEA